MYNLHMVNDNRVRDTFLSCLFAMKNNDTYGQMFGANIRVRVAWFRLS